jgi:anti-sigma factor ChrR (cupin superfamily)
MFAGYFIAAPDVLAWQLMNNLRLVHRSPHLRSDSIERYSFGQLSGLSLKRTEEHLLLCAECRERLDEFEMMLTAIRAAHEPMTMTNGGTHVFA